MNRRILFITLAALLILAVLPACSAAPAAESEGPAGGLKMASMAMMPQDVQSSSETVREAYQFAVANPDVLQEIPCYCGCGGMGHTSNYACYVQSVEDDTVVFDSHALGCSICVDITQDTMRMMMEGKSLPEIKAAIDDTYGQYGPSNME